MKILTFSGSLRKDSLNKKLCGVVSEIVKKNNLAEIEFIDLQPLNIPVYDGDIEASGIPAGVIALANKISNCKALIICTPEYNGSIPGSLKNVIDWLSRQKPVSLTGKPLLLLAASPGALGGVRALWHSRQPFDVLNVQLYPEMMGISKAHETITAEKTLSDVKLQQNLERLIKDFITYAQKLV